MSICKMCLKDKPLVKAHIMPYSFFRYIKDSPDEALEMRSTNSPYKERSPKGIYDKTILCLDCEKIFGPYDDYAQKLLLPDFKKEGYVINEIGKRIGCILNDFDYTRIKLFFISVLWRASVSSRKEFGRVKTGPFESCLKQMIQKGKPEYEDDFSIILYRFDDYVGKKIFLDPHMSRIDGINFCQLYLGAGYKVLMKVDKRPIKDIGLMANLVLHPSRPLSIVINKNFLASKEFSVMAKIVRDTKK